MLGSTSSEIIASLEFYRVSMDAAAARATGFGVVA